MGARYWRLSAYLALDGVPGFHFRQAEAFVSASHYEKGQSFFDFPVECNCGNDEVVCQFFSCHDGFEPAWSFFIGMGFAGTWFPARFTWGFIHGSDLLQGFGGCDYRVFAFVRSVYS